MPTTKRNAQKTKGEKTRDDVALGLSLAGGAFTGFASSLASRGAPAEEEESSSTDLALYLIPGALVLGGGFALWKALS